MSATLRIVMYNSIACFFIVSDYLKTFGVDKPPVYSQLSQCNFGNVHHRIMAAYKKHKVPGIISVEVKSPVSLVVNKRDLSLALEAIVKGCCCNEKGLGPIVIQTNCPQI